MLLPSGFKANLCFADKRYFPESMYRLPPSGTASMAFLNRSTASEPTETLLNCRLDVFAIMKSFSV